MPTLRGRSTGKSWASGLVLAQMPEEESRRAHTPSSGRRERSPFLFIESLATPTMQLSRTSSSSSSSSSSSAVLPAVPPAPPVFPARRRSSRASLRKPALAPRRTRRRGLRAAGGRACCARASRPPGCRGRGRRRSGRPPRAVGDAGCCR